MWIKNLVVVFMGLMVSVYPICARGGRERMPTTTPPGPSPIPSPPATPAPPLLPETPPPQRYYQTSTEIQYTYNDVNSMANSGCCFMACLGIAQTHAQKNLTATQINSLRNECYSASPQQLGSDFFVNDISGVINRGFSALGVGLRATVVGRTDTYKQEYICDATLIYGEQGDADGGYHFVEGDSFGIECWNPHPVVTITRVLRITYIRIEGYR